MKLIGEKSPPVELPQLECELGKEVTTVISLENPTENEIELTGIVSNSRNFSVSPKLITIAGYGQADVTLTYSASLLKEVQNCEVTFRHPQVGEWIYLASGQGVESSTVTVVDVVSPVGQSQSVTAPFRNPFDKELNIKVSLLNPSTPNVFQLMSKKPITTVAAAATFNVPMTFSPAIMSETTCNILVETVPQAKSDKVLRWMYLIKGVTEAPASEDRVQIVCKARKRLETLIELPLGGLGDGPLHHPEALSFELQVPDADAAAFLRRCFVMELKTQEVRSGTEPVVLAVAFEPLRPIRSTISVIINKASGGRWRYELDVIATDPDIDDVIRIQSPIHKTSSVSFRLTNQFDTFADYRAHFSRDSPFEFTVSPDTGVLPPYGHDGAQFIVSFTPHEYGKMLIGRLIIATDDMQWTYEVRGTHPTFVAPNPVSTIDDHLTSEQEQKLALAKMAGKGTNYMSSNAKTLRNPTAAGLVKPKGPPPNFKGSSMRI